MSRSKDMPAIISEVGFDFSWDERKVWEIDAPVEAIGIDELTWHLDIPFLWSKPDGCIMMLSLDGYLSIRTNIRRSTNERSRLIRPIQSTSCGGVVNG